MLVILAKHNGDSKLYAYELTAFEKLPYEPKSGDYAIVEDKNDFSLVKVIMVGEIKDNYQSFLTGHAHVRKKVVAVVPRKCLKDD